LVIDALDTVKASTVILALPLIPILLVVFYALMKQLKQDFGAVLYRPYIIIKAPQQEASKESLSE
jgi:BCCT family betaine/carnitine transporter